MARKNYHKKVAEERKLGMSPGMLLEHRKEKAASRPTHKPKALRKVIKSESIKRNRK